ncbi:hypothetical protein PR001_g1990 [Phytophthora rubi]|uniref:ELMO domain-containing protein n=1 Tax=Phytophthora rubi TaxID=129364 RepID=A0A6A3NYY8_9STRA|nr:hypothetical protein PR001_g1990 [Phytophthora rubi]
MDLDGPSDVDVLDDLLHDVDGEGDTFEEAEAFFDADPDQDGEDLGDMTTDNILSQLDAVTNLDDDDALGDNADEFHDSASVPSSPRADVGSEMATINLEEDAVEGDNASASLDPDLPEQTSPISSEDVVQAVLDLAADDEVVNEEEGKELQTTDTDAEETTLQTQEPPLPIAHNEEEMAGDLAREEPSIEDAIIEAEEDSPPAPPAHEVISEILEVTSTSPAVPPPAPATVPVIVGSMNPVEDENDDSDDSQGEEDDESSPAPPPLQLNDPDDDDEDVLEVDAEVVSNLEIEEKQRMEKRALSIGSDQPVSKPADVVVEEENALLKALPSTKSNDTTAMELSFEEEVRVAHVTTLEPSSPFFDIHKMAGGANAAKLSADATFGISYQSMRKNADEYHTTEDKGGYTLPSGPAFPDEREFENELALTSDLSFSVATAASTSPSKDSDLEAGADEDEFAFDIKPAADLNPLSDDELRTRRESLEARKLKEEEELLKELKRATDEEKMLIESTKATETAHADSTGGSTEAPVEPDALSLTELHNIYKRGLGDQEVLIDENENVDATKKPGGPEISRSMSVMGRIFSQAQGATETIAEEADGDDDSEENVDNRGGSDNVNATDDNAEDTKTISEKSDVDEASEWREIKLVQHRQTQEDSGSGSTTKTINTQETASVSRISYAEAAGYYAETPDVMQHRDIIVSEDFPRGSCLTCLSRPRLTFAGAIEERDRVFCIAATAFDAHNDVVVGILQTIYRKITKSPRDVLLIGRHWEDIGFQGTDPSTDLRGCGVLSLLQILYLVDTYPDLAHRFHGLSQHSTRHFPFVCVLINVTLQCVVALRSAVLYAECNKHASVLSGMNRLFVALTSNLHDAIQSRSDEIPLIMKEVLDRGRTNPAKVIDEAFDGPTLRPSQPVAGTASSKSKGSDRKESDNNLEFTEIGLHSVDEE